MTVGQVAVEGWDVEANQVGALRTLRQLTALRVERFNRITALTRQLLDTPMALLSLRDTDDRWLTAGSGLSKQHTKDLVSLCSKAMDPEALTEIADLTGDSRFADDPLVTASPRLRFWAGQPIWGPSGRAVAMLCVFDVRPRWLSGAERARLADLAAWGELECATVQASLGLRAATRTERDFVAVVSHELRTPLTSVHGSLELLASGLAGTIPPPAGELVDVAVKNTERLMRLINDVLDLSRVQRAELRLRLADVVLADVIDHAVHAVAATAKRDGVSVVAKNGASLSVRGDADRLVQVVTNLVANAVSLSPPGESVEVHCENGQSHARIHVIDHGPGLPMDRVDRIFEPFVQAHVTDRRPGAGLGLAITRGIVEAHGGEVSARSTPGSGATFTVSLPVCGPRTDRPWW